MKRILIALMLMLGMAMAASAQTNKELSMRMGQQRSVSGKVTVRFISIVEDSRCPANAQCVWAGNAKVRIAVAVGRRAFETFELNSNLHPQAIDHAGYQIRLISLTPKPAGNRKMVAYKPLLTISVTRITR